MQVAKILIVEDEEKIARLLQDYLQQLGGYECHWLARGDQVMDYLQRGMPDLILLDLMLPGLDGLSVARAIRAQSDVPLVMVTARVDEIDRLLGLELGADDYICKPFSPREVVVRVKNILRRTGKGEQPAVVSGLKIDSAAFSAELNGQVLKLTPVEFSLLNYLAEQNGRVFSRDQLMSHIYSDYRVVSDRTIDTHIKNLRKKLADIEPGREFIESVYGVGYRFTG